jgi:hypothetical protein
MQYGFVLPADYDMAIIRRRIAERGHATDGLPGLAFKAYLWAERGGRLPSRDNLYAPFYLWRDVEGMNAFLGGPGFARLAQDFGRPVVQVWPVWRAGVAEALAQAACASCEIEAMPPGTDLGELVRRSSEEADVAVSRDGALAAVDAFEPAGWRRLRLRLWPEPPAQAAAGCQLYEVGRISPGGP